MDKSIRFIIVNSSIKKKINKIIGSKIKKINLSLIEALYLLIIGESNSISFKELTIKADCDKAMTTKVINSLRKKELVAFDKNYYLTEKGKKSQEEVKVVFDEFKNNLFSKIDLKELGVIYNKLIKLDEILKGEIEC